MNSELSYTYRTLHKTLIVMYDILFYFRGLRREALICGNRGDHDETP
jgi:hypothetical protein